MGGGIEMDENLTYYDRTALGFSVHDPYGRNAWQLIEQLAETNGVFEYTGIYLALTEASFLVLPCETTDGRRLVLRSGDWTRRDGQWVFQEVQPPTWLTIRGGGIRYELTFPRLVESPPRPDGEGGGITVAPLMLEFEGEEQVGNVFCKTGGAVHKAKKLYTKQNGVIIPVKTIRG